MQNKLSAIGMKRQPLALAIALLLGSSAAFADDSRDPAGLLVGGVSIIITESAIVTTEVGGTGSVSFRLLDPPTNIVQVVVTSADISEGQVQGGTVQFSSSNWNVAQQVIVVGQDDAILDGDIAYNVNLAATSADGNFNGATSEVGFTNLDNERARFIITAADLETTEAGGTGTFSVALSDPPISGVNVSIISTDTTEGRVTSASGFLFNASNWNVAQQVIVTGQDDALLDGDVNYLIEVRGGSGQSAFNNLYTNVSFVNLDNEVAPAFVITQAPDLQTTEGGGTASFMVALSARPNSSLNVAVFSSDTSEGQVQGAGTLVFDSNSWNVAQTIVVGGQDDSLIDGDIVYAVELISFSGDSAFNNLRTNVSLVNLDNDLVPSFVITQAPDLRTSESGSNASFMVALSTPPSSPLNVAVFSTDSTEGRVQGGAGLAFDGKTWNVAQLVVVTGQDDRLVDGDIGYAVELISFSGDSAFNNLRTNVSLVNLDNDVAGFVITQAPNLQTSEAGTNAIFSVALSAQPLGSVNVAVFSSDSSEGIVQRSGGLGFGPSTWNVAQQVVVIGQDDVLVDGDISYVVQLISASGDSAFDNLRTNVSLVNLDNDIGGGDPMLTTQSISRTQGSPRYRSTIGSVTDGGGAGAVNITVNGGSSANANGVEVQVLRNANGTISALVRAGCLATNASFTITANNGTTSNSRQLDVFVATGGNPLWCQWWPR